MAQSKQSKSNIRWPVAVPSRPFAALSPVQWRAQRRMAQQFMDWGRDPTWGDALLGPPPTEFIIRNRLRKYWGQPPLERSDIPEGANWDIPLRTKKERFKCACCFFEGRPYVPGAPDRWDEDQLRQEQEEADQLEPEPPEADAPGASR